MKESRTHHRMMVVGTRPERMPKSVQIINTENRMSKCMSGFLQIFDRHQILAGKRIHSTKRLPSTTEPPKHVVIVPVSPDDSPSSPPEKTIRRSKSPVLVPPSALSSCKEIRIPVSNATSFADGDENQRRSPSVTSPLMGLEPVSASDQKTPQTVAKPSLRRSGSESRVSKDVVHSKYIDDHNFQLKQPNRSVRDDRNVSLNSESSRTDPNLHPLLPRSDLEKRLKMRGMDEQFEVLQLKGVLRSTSDSNINFEYDRNLYSDKSSILLVKPFRSSSALKVDNHRSVNDSRSTRRYVTASPNRIESYLKACNPIIKTKSLSIEIQRRDDKSSGSLKGSPNDLHKLTPKRNGSVHHSSINRSHRNQKRMESSSVSSPNRKFIKNVVTKDESSSVSESIFSTPSTIDSERSKFLTRGLTTSLLQRCREGTSLLQRCREGTSLLQRCDNLLHSIEETNSTTESPPSSPTVLPSPVSILDSWFDNEELSSDSSPLQIIDLEATPADDFRNKESKLNDSDFIYISNIVQASQNLQEDSNISSIEKHLYNTYNTTNVSKSQRKLIFDVVLEILTRNRQSPSVKQIWAEIQKIREINTGVGILELVGGVIKKYLVEINGWRDYTIEMSDAILDIERLIFRDLVSEAIRDLAELSSKCMFLRTQRKLRS